MIYLYVDSKSGKRYLMDKNNYSIHIYYPVNNFNITKIITIVFVIMIGLSLLYGILNTDSIRYLFYVTIIGREVRLIIIITTIFMQIFLVLFYKRNFTKLYTGHKEKISINPKDEKYLLKKSLIQILSIASMFSGVGAVFLLPTSIAFIEYSNAVMYFWFLIFSSIFIRYPAIIIIKFFIPILKAYFKLKI